MGNFSEAYSGLQPFHRELTVNAITDECTEGAVSGFSLRTYVVSFFNTFDRETAAGGNTARGNTLMDHCEF